MAENTIQVRSKLKSAADGGHPTALWEVDPAHPGGEAFIAGPGSVEVAETAGVMGALRDDKIERVRSEKSAGGSK
jgi:hypothetical protein